MNSKPPPPLKRGPKVVARKSKEERDQLDQQAQQQRRDRAEAAEATRILEERKRLQKYGIDTRPARASGPDRYQGNPVTYRKGRGGRGGFIGSNVVSRPARQVSRTRAAATEASGPAESTGQAESSKPSNTTSTPASTSFKKSAGASAKGRAPLMKNEPEQDYKGSSIQLRAVTPTYLYIADDEDVQLGRDVDQPIEISDSDGDAEGTRRQQLSFVPHRLQRETHKDREADINDQSSSATVLPSQRDGRDGQSPTATRRKPKERVAIKPDPEAMEGVEAPAAQENTEPDPEHEQATASGTEEFRPGATAQDDMDVDNEERNKEMLLKKLRRTKSPRRPAFSTLEEREEYERQQDSLRNIAHEFGQITVESETDTIPESTNDEMVAKPRQAGALDNATYLFQFPPILPDLYAEKRIKTEPDTAEAEVKGVVIKQEDGERPAPPKAGESRRPYIEPGKVGKLRVHASGKMTLDWGGTALAAGQGMDTNFLQSVMMMKLDADENLHTEMDSTVNGDVDGAPPAPTASQSTSMPARKKEWNGEVTSFGQVRGKIVVTPDWAEILG